MWQRIRQRGCHKTRMYRNIFGIEGQEELSIRKVLKQEAK
jgi:hypothetical protein